MAINNQIRWRSKSVFENVILKHFSLKANEVAAQATEWCNIASSEYKTAVKAATADMMKLLAALPKAENNLKRGRNTEVVVLDSHDVPPPKSAKPGTSVIDLT